VWPTADEPVRRWGSFTIELMGAQAEPLTAGWTVHHCALRHGSEEQHVMVAQMQWQDMTAQVGSASCMTLAAQSCISSSLDCQARREAL